MPGSTTFYEPTAEEDVISKEPDLMMARQPPPVAPRTTSISNRHSVARGDDINPARSPSMDSLESSGSSSSGGGSSIANQQQSTTEYIPTRTVGKIQKLPSHNPLQFVKVHSPLCQKAEQQIKLTKGVKVTREALKEGEEEWQSNLDNWKSRRRKVSEKVIQRAKEMRQIEAEEQLRQDQYLQQQRKIKKFSEIIEERSSSLSYNLDLYIGQGDDSGLGGTPEPDDVIDSQNSILRSDTSEGMTSEAESIDSDIHKSDKINEKEPPKVPQKPRLKKSKIVDVFDSPVTSANHFTINLPTKDFDHFSSSEPSDVEGHIGDSEAISSEEDVSCLAEVYKSESRMKNVCDRNICNGAAKSNAERTREVEEELQKTNNQLTNRQTFSFNISIKPRDNRGFGFSLKGGKDQGCSAYIDSIIKYSPADVAGLKEDDTIISLNGELAADYSHASLIFSVKQAAYAGFLEIVISRSEKNASVFSEQKKSTCRKSSFAEKIALFSSGVNSTAEETKTPSTASKLDESKCESLVLRRKSAFENGRKENNVDHRRSLGLPQGVSYAENVDKRLSADLSQQNLPENGTVKKGPPPPVPVKPKLKPKTFHDLNKTDSKKTNGWNDIARVNSDGSACESSNMPLNVDHHENIFENECHFYKKTVHLNEIKLGDINKDACDNLLNTKLNIETKNMECVSYSVHNPSCLESDMSSNNLASNINIKNTVSEEINKAAIFENSSTISFEGLCHAKEGDEDLYNNDKVETEILSSSRKIEQSEPLISVSFTSTDLFHQENNSVTESTVINYENFDQCYLQSGVVEDESCLSEQNCLNNDLLLTSVCGMPEEVEEEESNITYNLSDNMNLLSLSDDNKASDPSYFENEEDNFCSNDNNSSFVDYSEENISNIQVNPSPLCLPLEKIDEDDVISASTTTSSETPDTETVIETLPSNLSPLPNDESNGEESSKILNGTDAETENLMETPVSQSSSYDASKSACSIDSGPITMLEIVPMQDECSSNVTTIQIHDESAYPDNNDTEYCRELDESIDQITSLDVIDEIEQRLMHQLEQQGETFEEMDEGLTTQLETDINKQWLYFSEEAELLDDLTPRNLEPPREPPPPPPPPELGALDSNLVHVTRTNSTRRIKKELWRRRSDFLGIEAAEGIDVDNILPPPVGLEEILKQEREQTQWLEKRLSLTETDISAPFYMNDSERMESQDFSQNGYCSEYFLEDPEDISEVDTNTANEEWKENLTEQSTFESPKLQYVSAPDMAVPVTEERLNESPQHKAKQNIYNLGAAPKAKIMDSNKWITEKVTPLSKKSIEPVFCPTTYNQNYWLAQDDERRRSIQVIENLSDKRYSMPPYKSSHPDVTVRTWGDREYEFQKQRPKSAVWNSTTTGGDLYESYSHKQDLLRTHSLDSQQEISCGSNFLESEVHKCSCCGKGLCEGSAMGIEALRLYFHIECFRCCLCHIQLGNGSCGTDVQVKNNQLYCTNCFVVD